ncbi:MAG: acetyl-CoA C-acyltransferase [Chitinophagales bacterium]
MNSVYVVDALRTPIGKYGGILSAIRPDDLAAYVIRAIIARNPEVDVYRIEDIIFGAANQAGEDNRNVARMAALIAGLPVSIPGTTVNRLCASSLDSIMHGARGIMCGDGAFYLTGGAESMSRAPFVLGKSENAFGRKAEVYDTTLGWRFTNKKLAEKYYPFTMGETAENVAKKWNVSREDQDLFAFDSQQKYWRAFEEGKFKNEIIPVETEGKSGEPVLILNDEQPRRTSMEKLSSLKPAFTKEGTVTAGNSSGINDGAACLMLASENAVKEFSLKPLAKIVSMAVAGVDPVCMGIGPVPATQKALQRAGLNADELDLIELNEAFASQCIACMRDLKLDSARVNVNGGAIALGHPLGCSGARISTTLLHEMKRRKVKFGLATMCVGVGQGAAIIYERVQ